MIQQIKILEPWVSLIDTPFSSISATLFQYQNFKASTQIVTYLPTSGLDTEYYDELSSVDILIDENVLKDEDVVIFVPGDSYTNGNNRARISLLEDVVLWKDLVFLQIDLLCSHQIQGQGTQDSDIDFVLHPRSTEFRNQLIQVHCPQEFFSADKLCTPQ